MGQLQTDIMMKMPEKNQNKPHQFLQGNNFDPESIHSDA
jgi:hypothetical protein